MDIIENKILVMVKPKSKAIIEKSLKNISDLKILEADSDNNLFKMIFNHILILVIIDETLPGVDISKIGTMLLSHKKTYNAPLLIITDTIQPDNFLDNFRSLQIDYIQKPFNEQLILAKIKIFFELFEQKNAVDQSIEELDNVYQKIIGHHDLDIEKEHSRKELINISSIAVNQMQQPLQNLQGNIYQLLNSKELSLKNRSSITSIKASTERIVQISKKLKTLPIKANQVLSNNPFNLNSGKPCKILYVESFDEDFNIFEHLMTSVLKCELIQAKTIKQGIEQIANFQFDLIFVTLKLLDGTGINLISRLSRLHLDIPVIFILSNTDIEQGAKAIAKGASAFLVKEDLSSKNILFVIDNTLRKVKLSKEVEDARSRITLISKKDYLTKLFNKGCFEEEIESETKKAKRYNTTLSILIVDFDKFKIVNQQYGYDTGDIVLTTSAALIQSMVRDTDVVCRYGGEEFGIVLPQTDLNGAKILAQRIKKKIADYDFEKDSNIIKVTVSVGIALYDSTKDTNIGIFIKKALKAVPAM